jgi:hypothetical protein
MDAVILKGARASQVREARVKEDQGWKREQEEGLKEGGGSSSERADERENEE